MSIIKKVPFLNDRDKEVHVNKRISSSVIMLVDSMIPHNELIESVNETEEAVKSSALNHKKDKSSILEEEDPFELMDFAQTDEVVKSSSVNIDDIQKLKSVQ